MLNDDPTTPLNVCAADNVRALKKVLLDSTVIDNEELFRPWKVPTIKDEPGATPYSMLELLIPTAVSVLEVYVV